MREAKRLCRVVLLLLCAALAALVWDALREGIIIWIVLGLLIFAAKVALVFVISLFVPGE